MNVYAGVGAETSQPQIGMRLFCTPAKNVRSLARHISPAVFVHLNRTLLIPQIDPRWGEVHLLPGVVVFPFSILSVNSQPNVLCVHPRSTNRLRPPNCKLMVILVPAKACKSRDQQQKCINYVEITKIKMMLSDTDVTPCKFGRFLGSH